MPQKPLMQFRENTDNAFIVNAIRKNASPEFQRRIPETTKANIQANLRNILNHKNTRNEFLDALVNQIGLVIVRTMNWENPLGKFKRGMLEFGDSIEEIQTGLVKSYVYDTDRDYLERALFGQHRPNVQASIHKITRQEYYPVTVNRDMLKRAFTSETGLVSLVNEIMASPTVSDNHDEFLAMSSLFRTYDDAEGFHNVNVADLSDLDTSNETTAKSMLKKIRSMTGTLQYLSTHYNASGMHSAATADQLELFITPEANAAIDVDALAGAFNVDRADVQSRVTVVPEEHFNMPGTQALLTTRDFFVVADSLYETTSQDNAVGLYENFYLHHHQVISASRFVPAVKFSTGATTPITVSNPPVASIEPLVLLNREFEPATTAPRGEYSQITGSAITNPTGGDNTAIGLAIQGANSPRTYITNTGALHPALDETAETLTVVAMATGDHTITATLEVTLSGDIAELWPNPQVIPDPGTGGEAGRMANPLEPDANAQD